MAKKIRRAIFLHPCQKEWKENAILVLVEKYYCANLSGCNPSCVIDKKKMDHLNKSKLDYLSECR